MNIIGGDGSGGYKRTRPGQSFANTPKVKQVTKLGKKVSKTRHTVESVRLTRTEPTTFAPCLAGTHRHCAAYVIQGGGYVPQVCICKCHRRKRRELPTVTFVANGPSSVNHDLREDQISNVGQVYVNAGKNTRPLNFPAVGRLGTSVPVMPQMPGLGVIIKRHADDLKSGKTLAKAFGGKSDKDIRTEQRKGATVTRTHRTLRVWSQHAGRFVEWMEIL